MSKFSQLFVIRSGNANLHKSLNEFIFGNIQHQARELAALECKIHVLRLILQNGPSMLAYKYIFFIKSSS